MEPYVDSLYEASTGTWQHVVCDPSSRCAVVIDPVLDREIVPCGAAPISTVAADKILRLVRDKRYTIERILETHASDHRSSAWYLRTQLREQTGMIPRVAMGKSVQGFRRLLARKYAIQSYNLQETFDTAYLDGETIDVGNLEAYVFRVAGAASEHVGYVIGRNVFVGPLTTESPHVRFGSSDKVDAAVIDQLSRFPADFCLHGAEANAPVPASLPGYQPPASTSIGEFCSRHGVVVEKLGNPQSAPSVGVAM